jgi:hypothetical protein
MAADDCTFQYAPTFFCVHLELRYPNDCSGSFPLNNTAGAAYIATKDAELLDCFGGDRIVFQSMRYCPGSGCSAEPMPVCVEGRCEFGFQ